MSKHTTLDQLKMLAQRTKTEIDAVESKGQRHCPGHRRQDG